MKDSWKLRPTPNKTIHAHMTPNMTKPWIWHHANEVGVHKTNKNKIKWEFGFPCHDHVLSSFLVRVISFVGWAPLSEMCDERVVSVRKVGVREVFGEHAFHVFFKPRLSVF